MQSTLGGGGNGGNVDAAKHVVDAAGEVAQPRVSRNSLSRACPDTAATCAGNRRRPCRFRNAAFMTSINEVRPANQDGYGRLVTPNDGGVFFVIAEYASTTQTLQRVAWTGSQNTVDCSTVALQR